MYKCNNPVNWHWSKWVFRSYLIYNICTFMQLLALMNFHLTITIWGEEKTDLSFYTVTMSRILDKCLLSYILNEIQDSWINLFFMSILIHLYFTQISPEDFLHVASCLFEIKNKMIISNEFEIHHSKHVSSYGLWPPCNMCVTLSPWNPPNLPGCMFTQPSRTTVPKL